MKIIMQPTKDPATAQVYIPGDDFVSVAQTGLAGTEKLVFEMLLDGVWTAIVPEIALEGENNLVQIGGPCTYRIVKGDTDAEVTVFKDE